MRGDEEYHQTTTWEKIKKAKSAYKAARFYVWIGLMCGFALIGFEHLLTDVLIEHVLVDKWSDKGTWYDVVTNIIRGLAFIAGHLGIGFIVSSIAVFFYEWGAHIKEVVDLTSKLVESIGHTKSMMEAIRMRKNLIDLNDKMARHSLHLSINTLIGGAGRIATEKEGYLRKAITNCEKLVLAISDLHEEGAWANEQYIKFIANNLEEVVSHNAEAISNLSIGMQSFRVPPTAAQMADDILTAQMQAMNEGDRYDVISDLTSWQDDQLEDLYNETQLAIEKRGVQVRRVFNLLPYIYSPRVLPERTENILRSHLEASRKWKGPTQEARYEIKFLWPVAYWDKLGKRYTLDDIRNSHFGLFIHDHDSESVGFTVTFANLSDMTLCRRESDNKPFITRFEAVWAAASESSNQTSIGDIVNQIFRDLEKEKKKVRERQYS